jgi:hypothetical protein
MALYVLGAIYVTARIWLHPSGRAQSGDIHDVDQMAWFMRYAELAVVHFHLPALVTSAMNAPHTVNLMWNTSLLLPGVVMAPVTYLFGSQVTLNLLLTLGFAGSAASMYFVLRRWGASVVAAGLGGALYGFSPAMTGSGIGHYHLVLAMVPPLMIDAILRIVTGRGRPVRNGLWLGALASAQLFIGEEALIDAAIAAAVLLVVLVACRPRAVLGNVRPILVGGGTAAVTALVLSGRALWVQFHSAHASGAYNVVSHHGHLTHLYTIPYVFVVPANQVLIHDAWSAGVVARYPQPTPEYLAYLGIPLIIVLLAAGIYYWRVLPIRLAFLTFLLLELLSLGGQPIGPYPGAGLPWYWLQGLPMLSSTLPDRLSILADGAAAAVLAFALDRVRARSGAAGLARSEPVLTHSEPVLGRSGAVRPGIGAALRERVRTPAFAGLAVAVLALVPLFPIPYAPAKVEVTPAGYVQAIQSLHLPSDATVLVVPVPNGGVTRPMRWYAEHGLPQHMIGGDFIDAAAKGRTSRSGRAGETVLTRYLNALWEKVAKPGPPLTEAQVRSQMAAWKPAGIVADALPGTAIGDYLLKVLGPPAGQYGRFMVWRTGPSGMPPHAPA